MSTVTVRDIIEALGEDAAFAFLVGKQVEIGLSGDDDFCFEDRLQVADDRDLPGNPIVLIPSNLNSFSLCLSDKVECDVLDLFAMGGGSC